MLLFLNVHVLVSSQNLSQQTSSVKTTLNKGWSKSTPIQFCLNVMCMSLFFPQNLKQVRYEILIHERAFAATYDHCVKYVEKMIDFTSIRPLAPSEYSAIYMFLHTFCCRNTFVSQLGQIRNHVHTVLVKPARVATSSNKEPPVFRRHYFGFHWTRIQCKSTCIQGLPVLNSHFCVFHR